MKKISIILVLALLVSFIFPVMGDLGFAANNAQVKRLSGNSRIQTAIAVSKEAYPSKAETVILAGYNGQADALTGTLLASEKNAPLLLNAKVKLSDEVLVEIKRLGAKQVYILGGEAAISMEVENKLKSEGLGVKRLAGNSRTETAIAIAKEVFANSSPKEAFVIEYNALVDALSIGSVAAQKKAPIFITGKDKVYAETKDALGSFKILNATIIGGESTVSPLGKKELEKLGLKVDRVSGKDRIETALAVANKYNPNAKDIIIADGVKLADALVGGYLAAKINASILLIQKSKISDRVIEKTDKIESKIYILGGLSVINEDAEKRIKGMPSDQIVFKVVDLPKANNNSYPPTGTYLGMVPHLTFVTKDIVMAATNHPQFIDGGKLYRSTDGGINWSLILDNVPSINKIYFVDDKVGN